MAQESGLTHLDGQPCEPYTDSYFFLTIQSSLLAGTIVSLAMIFISGGKTHSSEMFWPLVSIGILSVIFAGISCHREFKSRKEAYAEYNRKLEIYEKRKSLVENNSGTWKSDEDRYKELFGL